MSTIKLAFPAAPATKRCLLLTAHGSRKDAANDEIRRLGKALEKKTRREFDRVMCAFLELAAPSIPQAIQDCIDGGATDIVIVPYFLSAGRHVAEDIPHIVKRKQLAYPQVKIELTPYLGAVQGVVDLLAHCACSAEETRANASCTLR